MRYRAPLAALALSALAFTACGDKTTTTPSGPSVVVAPTVTAVSPTTGATLGGTPVTVSGLNFAAGAAVAIGGVAATSATVVSSTTITAVAGAHAAGAADVVVTQGDQSSTLAAAFTYVTLPPPTVTSVFPSAGSSAGGTTVTITGTNFAPGATVTVGGVAASSVAVVSLTSLTAVTGAHATGSADVMVTVGGQSGTLARAFTYLVPGQNLPPVISSLKIQSAQPNAPADFADLNESVPVTAVVTDAETPLSQLTLEWSADLGTVTGTGLSVLWRMPAAATTPRAATITLKVVEALGGSGGSQSVSAKQTLTLHDSEKEISDISYQFLLEFSQQTVAPDQIIRNFYMGCAGRSDELSDVTNNQKNFKITAYKVATTFPVTVNFSSKCPFRNKSGDGCAQVPVEWKSTCLSSDPLVCTKGLTYTTTGTDQTTAVFRQSRWWLCDSDFDGAATSPYLPGFIR